MFKKLPCRLGRWLPAGPTSDRDVHGTCSLFTHEPTYSRASPISRPRMTFSIKYSAPYIIFKQHGKGIISLFAGVRPSRGRRDSSCSKGTSKVECATTTWDECVRIYIMSSTHTVRWRSFAVWSRIAVVPVKGCHRPGTTSPSQPRCRRHF